MANSTHLWQDKPPIRSLPAIDLNGKRMIVTGLQLRDRLRDHERPGGHGAHVIGLAPTIEEARDAARR